MLTTTSSEQLSEQLSILTGIIAGIEREIKGLEWTVAYEKEYRLNTEPFKNGNPRPAARAAKTTIELAEASIAKKRAEIARIKAAFNIA